MKKSEKIEVRLSHEEKQKLTEIADGEGRSVSELVRGLIGRYMAMSKPLSQKMPWGKIAAVAIAGVLLGHLGTWAMMRGEPTVEVVVQPDVFQLIVSAHEKIQGSKEVDSYYIQTPIAVVDGDEQTFEIIGANKTLSLSTKVTQEDGLLPNLTVSVCAVSDVSCEPLVTQSLLLDFQTKTEAYAKPNDSMRLNFKACSPLNKSCY